MRRCAADPSIRTRRRESRGAPCARRLAATASGKTRDSSAAASAQSARNHRERRRRQRDDMRPLVLRAAAAASTSPRSRSTSAPRHPGRLGAALPEQQTQPDGVAGCAGMRVEAGPERRGSRRRSARGRAAFSANRLMTRAAGCASIRPRFRATVNIRLTSAWTRLTPTVRPLPVDGVEQLLDVRPGDATSAGAGPRPAGCGARSCAASFCPVADAHGSSGRRRTPGRSREREGARLGVGRRSAFRRSVDGIEPVRRCGPAARCTSFRAPASFSAGYSPSRSHCVGPPLR